MKKLAITILLFAATACVHHESRTAAVHSSALRTAAIGGGFLAVGATGVAATVVSAVIIAGSDGSVDAAPIIVSGLVSAMLGVVGGVMLGSADATLAELPAAMAEDEAMRAAQREGQPAGSPTERSVFDED